MNDSQDLKLAATIFAPREAIAAELLPHAFDAVDGSHDVSHLNRVWRNATAISQSDGGDLDILLPAVILHDCVAVEKDSPQRAQASRMAADKASRVLKDMGFSTDLIFDIAHAIQAHSFSAGIEPRTLEAAILRDADRLDAIGAIGMATAVGTAGLTGAGAATVTPRRGAIVGVGGGGAAAAEVGAGSSPSPYRIERISATAGPRSPRLIARMQALPSDRSPPRYKPSNAVSASA